MNSKRSAKRSRRFHDSQKVKSRPVNNSETPRAHERKPKELSTPPKAITAETLREHMRVEDQRVLGPGGMRNLLCLDTNVDPVALASIAANMISKEYSCL